MKQDTEYLTYLEASRLLGLPLGSVYSLVARKRLPHLRYGRRCVRFARDELEAWIKEHRIEVPEPTAQVEGSSPTKGGKGV